jgi:hypothetical protein
VSRHRGSQFFAGFGASLALFALLGSKNDSSPVKALSEQASVAIQAF